MSQQPDYDTEVPRQPGVPAGSPLASAAAVSTGVRPGRHARTQRSRAFWTGFLVGAVLTIGILLRQAYHVPVVCIVQPIVVPWPDDLGTAGHAGATPGTGLRGADARRQQRL